MTSADSPQPEESVDDLDQLQSYLQSLLTTPGTTSHEEPIVTYIDGVLRGMSHLHHVDSNAGRYGSYCVSLPDRPPRTPPYYDNGVLLCAHCDIVRSPEEMIECEFRDDSIRTVVGTGLDNRLSCAILLNLLHYLPAVDVDRPVICLFCTEEEIGFHGSRHFARRVSIRRKHKVNISDVIVLDATFGKHVEGSGLSICPTYTLANGTVFNIVNDFYGGSDERVPTIGSGHCPAAQPFGDMDEETFNHFTDLASFRSGVYARCTKRFMAAPVIDMHHSTSYASMNDIYGLYCHLRDTVILLESSPE